MTLGLEEDDVINESLSIKQDIYNRGWVLFGTSGELVLNNNLYSFHSADITNSGATTSMMDIFNILRRNGKILFEKGESFRFNLTNLRNYVEITNLSTNYVSKYNFVNSDAVESVYLQLFDINGNRETVYLDDYELALVTDKISLGATTPEMPFDVYRINLVIRYDKLRAYNIYESNFDSSSFKVVREFGYNYTDFSFNTVDKTQSLLGSIIEIIRNIWTGITELPQKIADSIKGFFDNVVNALVTLGNTILDGIKALFVPTEEDIVEVKEDWETLLEDRFGALYECIDIIGDYADTFQSQEKGTITMPTVNLDLAGATYSFGGWEVQIVPERFSGVFNSLKMIISIVCTFLFVNGLKNRFEKLIGGSTNI